MRTFGPRRVLDGVSLTAAPGRRIGLIGENGTGKSTLLRLLAGADEPDGGTVVRPPDLGYLHQVMPFDPAATVRVAATMPDGVPVHVPIVGELLAPPGGSVAPAALLAEVLRLVEPWLA